MASTKTSNILYGVGETDGGDLDLYGDLYAPDPPLGPVPIVINFHGGGFSSGAKGGADTAAVAAFINAAGYFFFDCNYRLQADSPTVPGSEATEAETAYSVTTANAEAVVAAMYDMKTAVRWAKANAATYKFDASKVIVAGNSAGAITAATCALSPTTKYVSSHASNNLAQSNEIHGCIVMWGGSLLAIQEGWIDSGDPPMMFFDGDADANAYTLYADLVMLLAALTSAGVAHTDYIVSGGTHANYSDLYGGLSVGELSAKWLRANFPNESNPQSEYSQKAFQ